MSKTIHVSGTRKKAVARATLRPGAGKIMINKISLENFTPEIYRMKIMEPLILADKVAPKVDISVKTMGGGVASQAEAARLAIARALVEHSKSDAMKKQFLEYDRHLLVADVRQKEPCKPNDSKARAKRQKSYR